MAETDRKIWPNRLKGKSWLVVPQESKEEPFVVVGVSSVLPESLNGDKSGSAEGIIYVQAEETDQYPQDEYYYNENGGLKIDPVTKAHIVKVAQAIQGESK